MTAKEAVRHILDMITPPEKLHEICEQNGIEAEYGATYKELLFKSLLKWANDGDPKAIELAKKIGIYE